MLWIVILHDIEAWLVVVLSYQTFSRGLYQTFSGKVHSGTAQSPQPWELTLGTINMASGVKLGDASLAHELFMNTNVRQS